MHLNCDLQYILRKDIQMLLLPKPILQSNKDSEKTI